jgi:hypothetical protein
MNSPTMYEMMTKVHGAHLLEEVRRSRIPRERRMPGRHTHRQLLARLGRLLIAAGCWLEQRYTPAVCPSPNTGPLGH